MGLGVAWIPSWDQVVISMTWKVHRPRSREESKGVAEKRRGGRKGEERENENESRRVNQLHQVRTQRGEKGNVPPQKSRSLLVR